MTQTQDIQITTPPGSDTFVVRQMTGIEDLGQPFEFHLDLESDDRTVTGSQLIGHNATVRIPLAGGGSRCFNGCIRAFTRISG